MSVTTQSLKLCVTWPVVHLCGVGASHTSHLLILFDSDCDYKQWGGETTRPTLLPCRPQVHIRNWWPLSSSKSSNRSWWECLLFTCNLNLDERTPCAEKPVSVVCSFYCCSSVYHSVQLISLSICILQDDVPVQPMGQVQGAVQPSQQHL